MRNDVQQGYIDQLMEIYQTSTDDLYDNMNFIQALRYMSNKVLEDSIQHAGGNAFARDYVLRMDVAASNNWEGWASEDTIYQHERKLKTENPNI